jgi:hypothetical protein
MRKIRLTSQALRALSLELFNASSNNVMPAQAGIQKIVVRVFRPVKKGEPEGSDYIVMKIKKVSFRINFYEHRN